MGRQRLPLQKKQTIKPNVKLSTKASLRAFTQLSTVRRRFAASVLCILSILLICAAAEKTTVPEQKRRIVIATKMLLDGRVV